MPSMMFRLYAMVRAALSLLVALPQVDPVVFNHLRADLDELNL